MNAHAPPFEQLEPAVDPQARHYDAGGIEAVEVIKAKLTPEQYQGFLLGNVIKYTLRANHKGQFQRDIEKAATYARWLSLWDYPCTDPSG